MRIDAVAVEDRKSDPFQSAAKFRSKLSFSFFAAFEKQPQVTGLDAVIVIKQLRIGMFDKMIPLILSYLVILSEFLILGVDAFFF